MSREKQDDWKRTQVRIPQDRYDDVVKYAEQNSLSLNSAMLDLIEKGLNSKKSTTLILSEGDSKILEQAIARLQKIESIEHQLTVAIESLKNLQSIDIKKAP